MAREVKCTYCPNKAEHHITLRVGPTPDERRNDAMKDPSHLQVVRMCPTCRESRLVRGTVST